MATVSVRLPEDLQAELDAYIEEENLDRSTAVRKLLSEGLEAWRVDRAVDRLEAGEVSFARAADLAGMNLWDFARVARERGVTWVGREGIEDDLDAV